VGQVIRRRVIEVSSGNFSAGYTYLANSPLIQQVAFKDGTTTRMTTTKSYHYLIRLLSISSMTGSTNVSSHAYTYNDANQRTRAQLGDGSYWIYEYDKLGQVISGKRYWADGTLVPGQQHEYAFDDIGNRTTAKTGGDASGQNLRSSSYTANNLNQYSSRTVPGYVQAMGIANPSATVTVNGQSTSRKGEFYHVELAVGNTSAAQYPSVTNLVVLVGTTNMTNIGNIFLPKTAEAFSYDSDGNLTNDGRWVYTWDGENRLIQMESQTSAPVASKRKVIYTYDHQSRLISRKAYKDVSGSYAIQSDTKWVYDGWRQLAELNATSNALVGGFTWGLDLSGSMDQAGGIGGLLMFADQSTLTTNFYPYDGNGNVMALVKATDGTKCADYEYGPFGEVIRSSGTVSKTNPFRFSTKCQDEETELVYYGYRFYNTSTGRWPNRDPLGEVEGANLYRFVLNSPMASVDATGLRTASINIFHSNLNLDKCIKDDVNRILQNCMKTCCKSGNKAQLDWIDLKNNKKDDAYLGGYDTDDGDGGFNVGLNGNAGLGSAGYTQGYQSAIGTSKMEQGIAMLEEGNRCQAYGTVIAHEVLFRAVSQSLGYGPAGSVDALRGPPGGNLSPGACKKLCKALKLD